MHKNDVRPTIMKAFIDYGDIMTEVDFQLNYFPTDSELLALKLSVENFFADSSNLEELRRRINKGTTLTEDTWWRIRNDLI